MSAFPQHLVTKVLAPNLDDERSLLSASSNGSATLIDISSQRSSATINASQMNQYRKLVSLFLYLKMIFQFFFCFF